MSPRILHRFHEVNLQPASSWLVIRGGVWAGILSLHQGIALAGLMSARATDLVTCMGTKLRSDLAPATMG